MRLALCTGCRREFDRDTYPTCPVCDSLGEIRRVAEATRSKVPRKRRRRKAVIGTPLDAEIRACLKKHGLSATVRKYEGKVSRSEIYKIAADEEKKKTITRLAIRTIYDIAGLEYDKNLELVPLDSRWVELRNPKEPKPKKGKVFSRIVVDTSEEEAYAVDFVYLGQGRYRTLDSAVDEGWHRDKGNASKGSE